MSEGPGDLRELGEVPVLVTSGYYWSKQVVEAVLWAGTNWEEVLSFSDKAHKVTPPFGPPDLRLLAGQSGAQGWVPVPVGHWLVRPQGEVADIWPVAPDYFAAKYHDGPVLEPVEVGVRYCVMHHGVANEDDAVCDFLDTDHEHDGPCDFRPLFYREREHNPVPESPHTGSNAG